MKLIFGLGNPGDYYTQTRHNLGFLICDKLANEWGSNFKHSDKFHADIAEIVINNEKIIIAKPTTFYNDTGLSARAICDFYKISSSDVLIIHDDINLPIGTIRIRIGGSDGGNNGVKSLNSHIGEDTTRMRIGTHIELRDKIPDSEFVLSKFTKSELDIILSQISTIKTIVNDFLNEKIIINTYKQS